MLYIRPVLLSVVHVKTVAKANVACLHIKDSCLLVELPDGEEGVDGVVDKCRC